MVGTEFQDALYSRRDGDKHALSFTSQRSFLILVRELVNFRGLFRKKASQWPRSIYGSIRELKNVVDNFVKRYEGIHGLLNNGNDAEKL